MALTGNQLLEGFSRFIADWFSSSTTGAGVSGGTTLVDTVLRRYGEDYLRDWYLRSTIAGTNQYVVRRVTRFAASSGIATVAPGWAAQVAGADTYELHRYDPAEKFSGLDEARLRAYPDLAQIVFNATLTGDGIAREFDVPSAVRTGPVYVFMEEPVSPAPSWNFLTNPRNDSTTGWTPTNITATTATLGDSNLVVPKYDSICTKLVTAATTNGRYRQVVADMSTNVTAANVSGQRVTFGAWVYCRTASRVTLEILDDDGTAASATHGGGGWELLTVSRNIAPGNATTLAVEVDVSSAAADLDIYLNRSWFYVGDAGRIRDIYPASTGKILRRDDTTQRIYLDDVPARGRQLLLVGRDSLSALGTTLATQATNTMELDE